MESSLLYLWITFTAVAAGGLCAVLIWAVRSGQFGDQERARWLPLWSGIAEEHRERPSARLETRHALGKAESRDARDHAGKGDEHAAL